MTPRKKDQIQIPGISRQDGELAIDFVDFLATYENLLKGSNIYLALADYCVQKKFSTKRVNQIYNLAHMYVHKILRHKKYLDENLGTQGTQGRD